MKTLRHEEADGRDYRDIAHARRAIGNNDRRPIASEWFPSGKVVSLRQKHLRTVPGSFNATV
ncbi:MAG: hypothetical protein ACREC3_05605 [Methyloceanibacter sp.]